MVARPQISISAEEPKPDRLGQLWCPGKVVLNWPDSADVSGPSIQISLVASVRGDMTVDELRAAHIQAAHDVLSAALLSLESGPPSAAHTMALGEDRFEGSRRSGG